MSDPISPSILPLAAGFPPATEQDWRMRVEAVLKGACFEERLCSRTADGITIAPLYPSRTACAVRRPIQTRWTVVQRADHPDPARANAQALDDLNHGATGLQLVFADDPRAHGFGLAALNHKAVGRLFQDVKIDAIEIFVSAGRRGGEAAQCLAGWIAAQPVDPERLRLTFGLDPINSDGNGSSQMLRHSVESLRKQGFRGPFVEASGISWHDAGASEAQELAFALAAGVAGLRALDHLDDEHLKRAVSITLAGDHDMFLTLAKFRAARLLWQQVLAASGLPTDEITIGAQTSWRMMTALDAHTNILRSTAAVFGAALGGADWIAVLPFSAAQGLPNEFARRIARNTQTILQEESNLWRVSDPACGAGFFEHLTGELCDHAWSIFQQIERDGGLAAFVKGGRAAELVKEKRERRLARIRNNADTIIGVTAYRAFSEMAAAIEMPHRSAADWRLARDFEAAELSS